MNDLELLEALGVEVKAEKKSAMTPREERIIAGFEEIQSFVDSNGRLPQHGEDKDIFERLYAVRLDKLRESSEAKDLLSSLDVSGILSSAPQDFGAIDDDELLSQLGVSTHEENDVTQLKHVKPRAEKRAAEEIAQRTPCDDFDKFISLFKSVQEDLKLGLRKSIRFEKDTQIRKDEFFILNGQKAYIVDIGDEFIDKNDRTDCRLRVIYDNGTESNLLMRSFQKALWKDELGRRITNPNAGPLFSDQKDDFDIESGTIYVLRSKSDLPEIKQHQEILHKIGVTGGKIETRIANAEHDPTFLLSKVDVVATYELSNINRTRLEKLLHKVFAPARLDIKINDRFGNPVSPKEWFLVPLFVIDEVVNRIKDGSISNYTYDVKSASLKKE